MPETRFLATHTPHTTTLPRAQPFRGPGGGGVAGSHVSASPAAGGLGQAQVNAARQVLSQAPGRQDARVNLFQRPGAGGPPGNAGPGGTILATNQRPTVTLIPRPLPQGAAQTLPTTPTAGVPFDMGETTLVGHLLDQFVRSSAESGDKANAALGGGALLKLTEYFRFMMGAQAQAQAQADQARAQAEAQAQAQVQAPSVPVPTRVQVPTHPTSPPYQYQAHQSPGPGPGPGPVLPGYQVIGQPPSVQVFPVAPPPAPAGPPEQVWPLPPVTPTAQGAYAPYAVPVPTQAIRPTYQTSWSPPSTPPTVQPAAQSAPIGDPTSGPVDPGGPAPDSSNEDRPGAA